MTTHQYPLTQLEDNARMVTTYDSQSLPGGTIIYSTPLTVTGKGQDSVGYPEGEEYVISKVVDHCATLEEARFRVRWYGYAVEKDTWEPPENIPRSHILRYYPRAKLTPGSDAFARARVG